LPKQLSHDRFFYLRDVLKGQAGFVARFERLAIVDGVSAVINRPKAVFRSTISTLMVRLISEVNSTIEKD